MALNINGVELDFDFTNPEDLTRYQTAMARMHEAGGPVQDTDPDDPETFEAYVNTLKGMIRQFTAFLDETFGDNTAEKLLGPRPSLEKIMAIQDAIQEGAEAQSRAIEAHFARYTPNRATRRGQQ